MVGNVTTRLSAQTEDAFATMQEGGGGQWYSPNFSNLQPSLAISSTVVLYGIFPSRDTGTPGGAISIGYIVQFATNFAPRDTAFAEGQLLSIAQNTALFSILGTTYGGDGRVTFQLPNFVDNLAVGFGSGNNLPSFYLGQRYGADYHTLAETNLPTDFGGDGTQLTNYETGLAINWVIHTAGSQNAGSANFAGSVHAFLGNFEPNGALFCDGRILQIADYPELYAAIGTIYGGDGQTTFALPDLRGRTIIGTDTGLPVGTYVGTPNLDISGSTLPTGIGGGGNSIDNHEPGLVMQVLIATQGIFPSRSAEDPAGADHTALEGDTAYLSQLVYYAGTNVPAGYHSADGSVMSIAQNQALYALIGTLYGGDGIQTFYLPDFGGRAAVHFDNYGPGLNTGSADLTITYDNIPGRTQDGDSLDNTIIGADQNDVFHGYAGQDTLIGNGGADFLYGDDGNDTLQGGAGNDFLDGGPGADTMSGGPGDDYYETVYALDVVIENPDEGYDTIRSRLDGFTLPDNVEHLVMWTANAVSAFGNALDNRIDGTRWDNSIDGREGNDALYGNAGNDYLFGYDGGDYLSGGNGNDTLVGGKDDDQIYGGDGNDRLVGQAGNDLINGGNDDDILLGGSEDDTLNGGAGNDVLRGGTGRDILIGGTGADAFEFYNGEFAGTGGTTSDRIRDFASVDGDRIDLSHVDANTNTGGDDAFTFIGTDAFSGNAGELRYDVRDGYVMIQGDLDGDGTLDFAIRVDNVGSLAQSDFFL